MNKKEVAEIRRQYVPERCTISRICGCYVDAEKNIKTTMKEAFLSLPEDDAFKYFTIFKKTLSGTVGRNLVNLDFPLEEEHEGGHQEFLLKLRNSKLKDDALVEEFYNRIIDTFPFGENYYIILIHVAYDVPGKATDGTEMYDASDNVFEYLLCSLCPVHLSKPGLGYNEAKNCIENRIQDWIVDQPMKGFLFPAFNDRYTDIHSMLYYTKNATDLQEDFLKNIQKRYGYQQVMTPHIGGKNLYVTSGHYAHYGKDSFQPIHTPEADEEYMLKPMNCPHHMMIYANRMHSYKDLPIRIGEIAHDFRYESSGTLKGIERGRHFCQNDAHLFVTPEQIKDEFSKVVDLIFSTYKDFGITDYRCVLSLRDPENKTKYHDDDEMWNKAEDALRDVMNDLGIEYTEEIGEAAFYGPKLDVNVKPAVGNEYTLSTCQLDFCLPAKFELTYIDKDGEK